MPLIALLQLRNVTGNLLLNQLFRLRSVFGVTTFLVSNLLHFMRFFCCDCVGVVFGCRMEHSQAFYLICFNDSDLYLHIAFISCLMFTLLSVCNYL